MTISTTTDTGPVRREVRHSIVVDTDVATIWRLISQAERWPLIFGPTVHAERLEGDDTDELIGLWATANDEVRAWTSRRRLDAARHRITFRQTAPAHPVATMGGTWILSELTPTRTEVVLDHDFTAVDDDPADLDWVARATDRNSTTELANLKALAEQMGRLDELTFSFTDTVTIDGSTDDVYRFLRDAELWPERLPHVARLDLTEESPGVQNMTMDTRTADGSTHTTTSIRVCFDDTKRIVYKQIGLPALLDLHTGEWNIVATGGGTAASSTHTVRIRPEAIETILGAGRNVEDAKEFVHRALSTNSTATLHLAKAFAEQDGSAEPGSGTTSGPSS